MLTIESAKQIIADVECGDWQFSVKSEAGSDEYFYLQASYWEADTITGKRELQQTRKWRLSFNMTKSELVQTALKAALTSAEHRTREAFLYKGERVYGPHMDVDALWEVAHDRRLDLRPEWSRDTPPGGKQCE